MKRRRYKRQYVPGPDGSLKDLVAMYDRIGSLAFRESDYYSGNFVEGNESTPTREAMARSRGFRNFVTLLRGLGVELSAFAAKEAPLKDDGWTSETLHELMHYEHTPADARGEMHCRHCRRSNGSLPEDDWEPLWEQRRERIKRGLYPDGPFNEEELAAQAKWRKFIMIFYQEEMCYFCQRKYEVEGRSEVESHPGLLEIQC